MSGRDELLHRLNGVFDLLDSSIKGRDRYGFLTHIGSVIS
jgi:hypothetical protein